MWVPDNLTASVFCGSYHQMLWQIAWEMEIQKLRRWKELQNLFGVIFLCISYLIRTIVILNEWTNSLFLRGKLLFWNYLTIILLFSIFECRSDFHVIEMFLFVQFKVSCNWNVIACTIQSSSCYVLN